jgi:hypothetical protein
MPRHDAGSMPRHDAGSMPRHDAPVRSGPVRSGDPGSRSSGGGGDRCAVAPPAPAPETTTTTCSASPAPEPEPEPAARIVAAYLGRRQADSRYAGDGYRPTGQDRRSARAIAAEVPAADLEPQRLAARIDRYLATEGEMQLRLRHPLWLLRPNWADAIPPPPIVASPVERRPDGTTLVVLGRAP